MSSGSKKPTQIDTAFSKATVIGPGPHDVTRDGEGRSSQALAMEPGWIIGGRYEIQEPLGKGGMGAIYAVVDQRSDSRLAIKILHKRVASSKAFAERFRREAQILDQFEHPGIVQIHDCGEMPDGRMFIVMDLLEGVTLQQWIAREAPLTAETLLPVVRGLCDALDGIHAHGLVHRDIKPPNVILLRDRSVKLIDFGVASAVELEKLTKTGQIIGTPKYMAPEQILCKPDLDGRSDIYSVGVILYRALTGKDAFEGEGLSVAGPILAGQFEPICDVTSNVFPGVARVVERAMSREPDARPGTAGELAKDFEEAVRKQLADTSRSTSSPSNWPTGRFDRGKDAVSPPTTAIAGPAKGRPFLVLVAALAIGAGVLALGIVGVAIALFLLSGSQDGPVPAAEAAVPAFAPAAPSAEEALPAPGDQDDPPATEPDALPAQAPVRRTIRITTEPAGGVIFRGDENLGRSPVTVEYSEDEPWNLVIRRPGFVPVTRMVDAQTEESLQVALTPLRRRARPPRARTTSRDTEGPDEVSAMDRIVNPWGG